MKTPKTLATSGAVVAIAATLACPSRAEEAVHCSCPAHLDSRGTAPARLDVTVARVLNLPGDLPGEFSVSLPFAGHTLTLHLTKNRVFGENTRFLIEGAAGVLTEIDRGPDRSYLGTVAGRPEFSVSAVLTKNGLMASINRPGEESISVEPVWDSSDGSHHQIAVAETNDHITCGHGSTPRPPKSTDQVAASVGPVTTTFMDSPRAAGAAQDSTATLRPSRVMEVLEYEVGVEIGSRAFNSETYNSNLATARASAQSIPNNLDKRYLSGAGIKHRLGTVIIRTNNSTDPLRDSVTATGAAPNASGSLSAFRNYWNGNAAEVGNTHDLAVYHVKSAPSGLAYVNSVGSSNRYATSGGNGATSWADGTLVHEFGHSWSLGHVPSNPSSSFYESKPRNNGGSTSGGGEDVFVSVMHGGGSHNIGRLSTGEANQVYNVSQGKRRYGDVIANPSPIKPFGHRDDVFASGSTITIDVIENDYDANNDVLDVHLLDTMSQQGGRVRLSQGTGPGGRNEIRYTPPSGKNGTDFFHYTVCDSTGRTDWGAVYVENTGPVVVNTALTKYDVDFGAISSPVQINWSAVTPDTTGDISWSGAVGSVDRGSNPGINNINRDFITSSQTRVLNHKVQNGTWSVTLNMGDVDQARDRMRVSAEGGQVVKSNISSAASEFVYVVFDVEVEDGELNLEFSDTGGASPEWALTRMSLERMRVPFDVPGLVAYYSFDEGEGSIAQNFGSAGTAADANQNQGSIGWTTTGQQVGTGSLNLDGSSSLAVSSPIPDDASEFTISVWVNPEENAGYKGIYSGRDSPGNWGINIENSKADVRFATSGGSSSGFDSPTDSVTAAGGWYHIAQTWVSSGSRSVGRVYLNGNFLGTTSDGRPDFSQPTNGFFIGDDPCCGGREFRGQIDDLAVLTRALSAEEISATHEAGRAGNTIVDALAPPPVVVPPQPTGISVDPASGSVSFSFETQNGVSYHIFSSIDLGDWMLLETITGDGTPYLYIDTDGFVDTPSLFYKIEN